MRNIKKWPSKAPKQFYAIVLLMVASIATPVALNAWSPARPTFTTDKPATYVTFNSITNNPAHGDERNFMQIREATASNTTYADQISVTPGKEYVVYVYYHNNASSTYNDAAHNYVGIAKGAYARAEVPAVVKQGASAKANAHVGASNANPAAVSDDITLTNNTAADIALRYVPGSTTIHSKGPVNGTTLPDTILQNNGVAIGYDKLDGTLPGCHEYAGYITFRIKADQPNFTFSKQVRNTGDKDWQKSVNAIKDGTVEYRLEYKNTGSTTQNDVVLKDKLPAGLTYVAGSSKLYNSTNPQGKAIGDGISQGGVNIGNYAAGANAILTFQAKVTAADLTCGTTTFTNQAGVETKNGNKQDTAEVKVKRECVKPIQVCDLTSKKVISIEEKSFDAKKYSKNLADCSAAVAELPKTGPAAMIGVTVALMAAGVAAAYFLRARQERQKKLETEFGAQIAMPKTKLLESHLTKQGKNLKK